MRARTDCSKCRKDIYNEAAEAYKKHEYAIFKDMAYTMAVWATVGALSVQVRRGRSSDYIKKMFDDMVQIFDMPELFGKKVQMTDIMHSMEQDYGIDFRRIKVHMESEKEFVKGLKV